VARHHREDSLEPAVPPHQLSAAEGKKPDDRPVVGLFFARRGKIKKMLAYLLAFVFFEENFVPYTILFLFGPPRRPIRSIIVRQSSSVNHRPLNHRSF
jgi:hypothetical protein